MIKKKDKELKQFRKNIKDQNEFLVKDKRWKIYSNLTRKNWKLEIFLRYYRIVIVSHCGWDFPIVAWIFW